MARGNGSGNDAGYGGGGPPATGGQASSPAATTSPSPSLTGSTNSNTAQGLTANGTQLTPTVGTDPAGNTSFSVNTAVAANPFLSGDLNKIGAQQAHVAGQTAAQASAAHVGPMAQATTPSQSLTAQSAAAPVNQQGFNAQGQALGYAQQQALGQGPAAQAVQAQTQNATNQGLNAQLSLAGSARGGNAGEIARQAAMGQAQVTGQAGAQAAANSLASQQAGQQNLGNISGAMQGESLGAAQLGQQNNQFNAGATNAANAQTQSLGEQTALANQSATNTGALANQSATNTASLANAAGSNQFTEQQNNQIQSLMNSGMSLEQAQQQANISMAEYATGSAADQYAAGQGHAISQQNADTSSANAAIQGLGTAANITSSIGSAVSDKRAKKDVKSATKDASAFLDHLAAKTWDYKNPKKHGVGRHLGVMAQDLEKSKMGKDMVKTGSDGIKVVEYGGAKGMAAIVASLAMLNEKLKALEGKRASK